jgi:hypothetical protein
MVFLQLVVADSVVPAIEPLKPSAPLARAINNATAADVPVATCGYDEPSLNFYLGRHIEHMKPAKAAEWLKQPGPGVLVISRASLDDMTARFGPLPAHEIASAKGFNYSEGKWIELVALERR